MEMMELRLSEVTHPASSAIAGETEAPNGSRKWAANWLLPGSRLGLWKAGQGLSGAHESLDPQASILKMKPYFSFFQVWDDLELEGQ